MSDPRTILGLDPTRFLSDGDAVAEWRPGDDDNVPHGDEWEALMADALDDEQTRDEWGDLREDHTA
jgi:hypothetical protein